MSDEMTDRSEEVLPDDEVDWEERLRREVVRSLRFRWRRLERLMDADRRLSLALAARSESPLAGAGESDTAVQAPEPGGS